MKQQRRVYRFFSARTRFRRKFLTLNPHSWFRILSCSLSASVVGFKEHKLAGCCSNGAGGTNRSDRSTRKSQSSTAVHFPSLCLYIHVREFFFSIVCCLSTSVPMCKLNSLSIAFYVLRAEWPITCSYDLTENLNQSENVNRRNVEAIAFRVWGYVFFFFFLFFFFLEEIEKIQLEKI